MKISTTLLLIFSLVAPFTVFAQLSQDTRQNLPTAEQYQQIKKYDAVVKFQTKKRLKGVLYKVTDEVIILLPKDKHIKHYSHFEKLTKKDQKIIELSSISKVTTRKSGKFKRNFLIGAVVGICSYVITVLDNGGGGELTAEYVGIIGGIGVAVGGIGMLLALPVKSHNPKDATKLEKLKKKGIMYGY